MLMMPGFTYFWRALVWFVRFDFFALGRRGQDERQWILGAVGCVSGNVGELATRLETRFQGQAVCIHDKPASDGGDRARSEV